MGQGDFKEEEFTEEEKAALGEVTETDEGKPPEQAEPKAEEGEKPPEDGKPPETPPVKTEEVKPDAETQAVIDEQGAKLITENGKQYVVDDEGSKIPVERFKKIYGKSKELERTNEETTQKFNLFKTLGAEKYYELYPSEKPADFKPATQPAAKTQDDIDYGALVVQSGTYKGLTLREVYEQDPVAATTMQNQYMMAEATRKQELSQKENAERQELDNAANRFKWERAKELFAKNENYTPEEISKVNKEFVELVSWMTVNKKAAYSFEDAYLLMNKDKILEAERIKAAKAAAEKLNEKIPATISKTGDNKAGLTGFEAVMAMSDVQLFKYIDDMSDKAQREFYKNAPAELKQKYPSLPW